MSVRSLFYLHDVEAGKYCPRSLPISPPTACVKAVHKKSEGEHHERLLLASDNDRAAASKRESKGSLQLGEWGTAARSLQRTSTDEDACAPATPTTSREGSRLVRGDFTEGNPLHARVEG